MGQRKRRPDCYEVLPTETPLGSLPLTAVAGAAFGYRKNEGRDDPAIDRMRRVGSAGRKTKTKTKVQKEMVEEKVVVVEERGTWGIGMMCDKSQGEMVELQAFQVGWEVNLSYE